MCNVGLVCTCYRIWNQGGKRLTKRPPERGWGKERSEREKTYQREKKTEVVEARTAQYEMPSITSRENKDTGHKALRPEYAVDHRPPAAVRTHCLQRSSRPGFH